MKKRFKSVEIGKTPSGFTLLLDCAPARTPLGVAYVIKAEGLAQAVANEWRGQGDVIRKETMPLTQLACVALDLAGARREEVCADILPYADTDPVCYRAGDIPELAVKQAELLDPVIAWAESAFGLTLRRTDGLMPIPQPTHNRAKLTHALSRYDDWKLAALAVSVKLTGSLILALALVEKHIDAEAAYMLSHLEEEYETRKWGRDEEKEARLHRIKEELETARRFLALASATIRPPDGWR